MKKLLVGILMVMVMVVGMVGCNSKSGSSDPPPPAAPPPIPIVAEFSGVPLSGIIPLEVLFSDSSTGEIDSWLWDFGDGNTSTLQNPIHIYNQPNQYTVSLTVTGSNGSDILEKVNYITVDPPLIEAYFVGTPLNGAAPLEVAFNETSTGNIDSWLWNFGDGNTSTERNPVHVYEFVGHQQTIYTVTLTITDSYGSDTMEKVDYITVDPPIIEAYFVGTPLVGNAPLEVTFNETSTGNIDSWLWNFGDGNISALQNPIHLYNQPNQYTVTLTVTDSYGSNTMTKVDYITVDPPLIKAYFVGAPLVGTAPLEVSFSDSSTGNIDSWLWNFGDGNISTERNPVHTYEEGAINIQNKYTVTLTVTDSYGSNTMTKVNYVNVSGCIYKITFITEGTSPSFDNGKGLFIRRVGDLREVYYYNGYTSRRVSGYNKNCHYPKYQNKKGIWSCLDGIEPDYELYLWDGVNIQQVTDNNNNIHDFQADIYNETYSWIQEGFNFNNTYNYDLTKITYFDGNTTRVIFESPIGTICEYPILYNGEIVWGNSGIIYKWNELTGTTIIHNNNNGLYGYNGSFDGNKVSFTIDSEIYLMDSDGSNKIRITNGFIDRYSFINNGEIAWIRDMDIYTHWTSIDHEIFWWDGFSEIRVTNNNVQETSLCWDKITGDLYFESNGGIYKIEMGVVP